MDDLSLRDYEVYCVVVDFERDGVDKLDLETDANFYGTRMDAIEEAIVETAAAA